MAELPWMRLWMTRVPEETMECCNVRRRPGHFVPRGRPGRAAYTQIRNETKAAYLPR